MNATRDRSRPLQLVPAKITLVKLRAGLDSCRGCGRKWNLKGDIAKIHATKRVPASLH